MTVVWSYDRQRQGLCGSLVSDYFRNTHLSDPTPLEAQMEGLTKARPDPVKSRGRKGKPAPNRTAPEVERKIVRLADAGWTQQRIASKFGVPRERVFRVLKRCRSADHRTRLRERAA